MLGPVYEIAERQSGRRARPTPAVQEVARTLAAAPRLEIGASTTRDDARASFRELGKLGAHLLGGRRFTGRSPWERHPFDDELLVATEGEAEITLLTDAGTERRTLTAGTLFVVPKGAWHRLHAPQGATIWGATNVDHDEISFDDDPRASRP
jgi:quercetin dioxygenase-like cupin family protein